MAGKWPNFYTVTQKHHTSAAEFKQKFCEINISFDQNEAFKDIIDNQWAKVMVFCRRRRSLEVGSYARKFNFFTNFELQIMVNLVRISTKIGLRIILNCVKVFHNCLNNPYVGECVTLYESSMKRLNDLRKFKVLAKQIFTWNRRTIF